jgi:hypothetical protein
MCVIGTLVRLQLIEFIVINEFEVLFTTETRSHRESQIFLLRGFVTPWWIFAFEGRGCGGFWRFR